MRRLSPRHYHRERRCALETLDDRRMLSAGAPADETHPALVAAALESAPPGSAGLSAPVLQQLNALPIVGDTGNKPQSKVWQHDGKWWSVLANGTGTWVWRLDGLSWTAVLRLSTSTGFLADVKPAGNLAHILLENDALSQLASIQYVAGGAGSWQLWSQRPTLSGVPLSVDAETATLDLDTTGRMWVASDATDSIEVRYSDFPYSSFSAPITLASGTGTDDISAVTAMVGGKIGVMWSDQEADRFGFRVHNDTDAPTAWSANEVPASQSAQHVGGGMADDHINVAVASDGTLYAAVKTNFNAPGYTCLALLVRRPNGTWDDMYQVDTAGSRATIELNEALGRIYVFYRNTATDGPIVFRDSPLAPIAFGDKQTLIAGTSVSDPSGPKENFTGELVVVGSHSGNLLGTLMTFALPPHAYAGPDRSVSAAVAVVLEGVVTDDGLPNPPGQTTALWSQISGPGTVTFTDPRDPATTAGFSAPGQYVLRLTASDSDSTVSDEVTIVVAANGSNVAPTIEAGANQTVELGAGAMLHAAVNDDHLPNPPAAVALLWRQVSGPGTATYSSQFAADTNVSFSALGTYVLRLEVGDGHLLSSDTLTITVTPTNFPPVTSAGPDQTVALAVGAALHGTVTDDGLHMLPGELPTQWTKISGPGSVTFGNASALDTTASFGQEGEYVLRLSASDGQSTGSDETTITVLLNLPNSAPIVDAGPDRIITLGQTALLDGTVTDDGLPLPAGGASLSTTWTKLSGPGTVTFGNSAGVDTTATFSQPGVYALRLSAFDGDLSGNDLTLVTVNYPPVPATYSFQNGASPGSTYAGTSDTKIKSGSTSNYGTATSLDVDGSPDTATLIRWDLGAVPAGSTVQSASITLTVSDSSLDTFHVYQLLRSWTESGATWTDAAAGSLWQAAGASGSADRGSQSLVSFSPTALGAVTIPLNAAGLAAVQSWLDNPAANFGITIQNYASSGDQVTVKSREASTAAFRPKLTVSALQPGPTLQNVAPVVSAGADQSIIVGAPAMLNGQVSDDGLPYPPGTVVSSWTKTSGPGNVTFADPSAANTTATFSQEGLYVLRLAAFDGALSASDEVTITVGNPLFTVAFQDGALPATSYAGTRDATLKSGSPTSNYQKATKLSVDGSPDVATLLQWDISAIPTGAVVQAASLTLTVVDASIHSYELYEVLRTWLENETTWNLATANTPWATPGANGASDRGTAVLGSITAALGQITVPLTTAGVTLVQKWLDNPGTNHGLVVQDYVSASDSVAFNSSEHTTIATRPMLSVAYTLAPFAAPLAPAPLSTSGLSALADATPRPASAPMMAAAASAGAPSAVDEFFAQYGRRRRTSA